MVKKFTFFLFFLLSSCITENATASSHDKFPKIAIVGDSLCEGLARPLFVLTNKNNISLSINCLHSTKIDYWSKRINLILDRSKPKVVIISLGTNDSVLRNPEAQRQHVKKIIRASRNQGSKILWLIPPRLPNRFKGQHHVRKILFEELNDHELFVSDHLNLETIKDKVHLSSSGYKKWSEAFWELEIFRRLTSKF